MRYLPLFIVTSISFIIMLLFIFEGKEDKQNLRAVMEVGGKTLKDITETTTTPIQVTTQEEIAIGRLFLKKFSLLPGSHPSAKRVLRLGRRLAKHCRRKGIQYQFYVVRAGYANAFALPGGFVLVTQGMEQMLSNDTELAWVIAHELQHIEKRHALLQMRATILQKRLSLKILRDVSKLGEHLEVFLRLTYSEVMELESDREGIKMLQQADFPPKKAIAVLDRFIARVKKTRKHSRNPLKMGIRLTRGALKDYFATHPHWERRKQELQKILKTLP